MSSIRVLSLRTLGAAAQAKGAANHRLRQQHFNTSSSQGLFWQQLSLSRNKRGGEKLQLEVAAQPEVRHVWNTRRRGSVRQALRHGESRAAAGEEEESKRGWLAYIRKGKSREEAQGTQCLYLKRSVRQFEEISHNGSIIVLGNVCPGSSITAAGDIVVVGRLAGRVHAGARGDGKAVVVAMAMEPKVIAIANQVVAGPEEGTPPHAEMAYISDTGHICIDRISHIHFSHAWRGATSPLSSSLSSSTPDPVMARIASRHNALSSVRWAVEQPQTHHLPSRGQAGGAAAALGGAGVSGPMSTPALYAMLTGLYIFAAGVAALVAPVLVYRLLLGAAVQPLGWIRVMASLAVAFGVYYMGAAWGDSHGKGAKGFYISTVLGRVFIFFSFCALVACGAAPLPFLVLGAVNLAGALSMLMALTAKQ